MSTASTSTFPKTVVVAACVLTLGGAGADAGTVMDLSHSARTIELGGSETSGTTDAARNFAYRGEFPTLLANDRVRDAVLRLETELTEFVGPGHGFRVVLEELVNPDDPDQDPLLYAIAILPGLEADELLDEFILRKWSAQPVEVRRSVRIGRELV